MEYLRTTGERKDNKLAVTLRNTSWVAEHVGKVHEDVSPPVMNPSALGDGSNFQIIVNCHPLLL